MCFYTSAAVDAEREPSLVFLERAEKAFADQIVGERRPKRRSIELDAVLFGDGFDPEHDVEQFVRVPWIVRADRQDLPVYTPLMKLQRVKR